MFSWQFFRVGNISSFRNNTPDIRKIFRTLEKYSGLRKNTPVSGQIPDEFRIKKNKNFHYFIENNKPYNVPKCFFRSFGVLQNIPVSGKKNGFRINSGRIPDEFRIKRKFGFH